MSNIGKETTLEEKLSNASVLIHIAGAVPLLFAVGVVSSSDYNTTNGELVENLLISGFGIEGLALILSGSAVLSRPDEITKREKFDIAGRFLLGTGFISIPALAVLRDVAGRNSFRSISAFTLLTIASGSIALGLSQDVGNIMKW
jgi:hypothetical protein